MCSPRAKSSPSFTVQNESFRFTVPARMLLTSVPEELDAGLIALEDEVVVERLAVLRHLFDALRLRHGRFLLPWNFLPKQYNTSVKRNKQPYITFAFQRREKGQGVIRQFD